MLWTAAAGCVLVAVTAIGWNAGRSAMHRRLAASVLTYTTANGQRANITLPDSSNAVLDVASRLDVSADYSTGNRTVRLTGRGMFTVNARRDLPFTVLVGSSAVHVLGTSFVVRRYAADSLTTVAVHDGKVAIGSLVVPARKQIAIGVRGAGMLQPADSAQFSFVSGVLTLNNVPLSAAVQELNRWYDADIRLGDPALATRHVQGEYVAGSLSDLSEVFSKVLRLRVERRGRVLILYPR